MSNIDPSKPEQGLAETADVRLNFQHAADEIDANVAAIAANLVLIGDNAAAAAAAQAAADAAQGTADTALANAATADGKAVAAQGDATQALSDAAAAQGTADAAMPKAGGAFTGVIGVQPGAAGGDALSKAQIDQAIADAIAAIPPSAIEFPIGAIMSGFDPNGVFPGTWTLLPNGTFIMASATPSAGGSNDAVPISHTHTAAQAGHIHAATQGTHNHSILTHSENGNNGGRVAVTSAVDNFGGSTEQASAGAITIDNQQPAITVDPAGSAGAGLNRPLFKGVAVWERTA